MKAPLFLWNDNKYSRTALVSLFGKDNVIYSPEMLQQTLKTRKDFEAFVILAELTWNKNKLTNFHGFDIATLVRAKYKLFNPIVFCSFLPEEFFLNRANKDIRYSLLSGRGSAFLRLPFTDSNLEAIFKDTKPLTTVSIIDVVNALCDVKGIVMGILHDLKGNRIPPTVDDLQNILGTVRDLLSREQREQLEYSRFAEKTVEALNGDKKDEFMDAVDSFERNCSMRLDVSSPSGHEQSSTTHRPHALILEDDDQPRLLIQKELEKRGFRVTATRRADEAVKIINNDVLNDIVLIIADWRLYEPNSKKWQQMQGYEVLLEASKLRFLGAFALTSLNDKNVHAIRNHIGINLQVFKKENLIRRNNWDVFADILIEKAEAITHLISSQPLGEEWSKDYELKKKPRRDQHGNILRKGRKIAYESDNNGKPVYEKVSVTSLKEGYRLVRNSLNWEGYEFNISIISDKLWAHYKNAFNGSQTGVVMPLERHGIEINSLENILLVRRIWLALWAHRDYLTHEIKEDHAVAIYSTLRQRFLQDVFAELERKEEITNSAEEAKRKISQAAKVFKNSLAIVTEGVPQKGILPEEKAWFARNNISFIEQPEFDSDDGLSTLSKKRINDEEPSNTDINEIEKLLKGITNQTETEDNDE